MSIKLYTLILATGLFSVGCGHVEIGDRSSAPETAAPAAASPIHKEAEVVKDEPKLPTIQIGEGWKSSDPFVLTPVPGNAASCTVTGAHGFTGTLKGATESDPKWLLNGVFVLPTGGWQVGAPISLMKKSYPEQISIMIPVIPPAPGAMVTMALVTVPIRLEYEAHPKAPVTICTMEP